MLIPMAPTIMFGTALHPVTHVDDTSPDQTSAGHKVPRAKRLLPQSLDIPACPPGLCSYVMAIQIQSAPSIEEEFEMLAAGRTAQLFILEHTD